MSGFHTYRNGPVRAVCLLLITLAILSGSVRGIALDFCFCAENDEASTTADPCCPQVHSDGEALDQNGPGLLRADSQDAIPCIELRLASDSGWARLALSGSLGYKHLEAAAFIASIHQEDVLPPKFPCPSNTAATPYPNILSDVRLQV